MRDAVEAGFDGAGIPLPRISAETIDPLAVLELVSHGLGVAIAPESFAALADATLRSVPLAGAGLARPLTLTWSGTRRAAPALAAFLELAPQALRGRVLTGPAVSACRRQPTGAGPASRASPPRSARSRWR